MKKIKKYDNFIIESKFSKLTSLDNLPIKVYGSLDSTGVKLKSLYPINIKIIDFFKEKNYDLFKLNPKYIQNDSDIFYICENVSQEELDKYFDFYVNNNLHLVKYIKEFCSKWIINKYQYLLNSNNFDLI